MIIPHQQIREETEQLYRAGGLPKGQSTGWPSLDKLYTVGLAQWTLITGTPGSGKSEWLDALMVNLAKAEPWKFFIYSPENFPLATHHSKILEKYIGKPFGPGPNERMSDQDFQIGEDWISDKFMFCKPENPSMLSIVEEGCSWASHAGRHKTGIVVDPYNQLEHHRPPGMSETEYISQALSIVINRVREYNVHLWLVAHPRIMYRDKDGKRPVPSPYDVAGSAHWFNKSDNFLTIARDQVEHSPDVDIHVQKVRFKHMGRIGMATLTYDRVTGRYREPLKAVRSYAERDDT